MTRILVTGATGFVGTHLMPQISSLQLRMALRAPSSAALPSCERVIVGDIDQHTDWTSAIRDVSCVVHMGGHVHVMKPTADDHRRFYEVNVLGTERLALAAAASGAKRFIFLSSIKVNGEATYGNAYTAVNPVNPSDDYGISKAQAEIKLFEIAKKTKMEVAIIRPPLVYGPGVRANFLRLLSWVHKGIPLPFGGICNARSLVSVWNLCDLIRCVIDAPAFTSGVLMVSDGVDLSTPELIEKLAMSMGRKPRLISVPVGMLKLMGAMTGRSAEVMRLCGSLEVDITATKQQFGWSPPVAIDTGLARTAHWYMQEMKSRGR